MKKITLISALFLISITNAFGYTYSIIATNSPLYPNAPSYDQVTFPYGATGDILLYTFSTNPGSINAHARAYYYVGGGYVPSDNAQGSQPYYGTWGQLEVWYDGNWVSPDEAMAGIDYF
jgi:hypothetical protein